jgi:hypothetical protein
MLKFLEQKTCLHCMVQNELYVDYEQFLKDFSFYVIISHDFECPFACIHQ